MRGKTVVVAAYIMYHQHKEVGVSE